MNELEHINLLIYKYLEMERWGLKPLNKCADREKRSEPFAARDGVRPYTIGSKVSFPLIFDRQASFGQIFLFHPNEKKPKLVLKITALVS